MPKKTFVIDGNVALHDSNFLTSFEENDLVLPMAVLEEIGKFVRGNGSINHHARETLRKTDTLSTVEMFNGGASLGPGLGKLKVRLFEQYDPKLVAKYPEKCTDHDLLNLCLKVGGSKPAILVSKKVALRIKAKSLGIQAEDYTTDRAPVLLRDEQVIDIVPAGVIDSIFAGEKPDISQGVYSILKSDSSSASCLCINGEAIKPQSASNIKAQNAQQQFALHALLDPTIPLVTLTGTAGTGKTLLALAAGLEKRKLYRRILLIRPLVMMGNLGYLPGSLEDKLDPFMQPLRDNLQVIKENSDHPEQYDKLLEEKKIEMEAIPYIRGRSIVKRYVIVDESQNLTSHEIKTFITRAGEGTKFVFTGDIRQIDNEYLDEYTNGLSVLIHKMNGSPLHRHVNMIHGLRSELAEFASKVL